MAYKKFHFSNKFVKKLIVILVLILSWCFLGYKLATFEHYGELTTQWKNMPLAQFWWLAAALGLLPLNWLLEAIKWRMLVKNIQPVSFKTSTKAVLAGVSTGFFTPNRVGEVVGRMAFMNAGNRKPAFTLSILNSLTQNLVIIVCGVPSAILFFIVTQKSIDTETARYLLLAIGAMFTLALLSFGLPRLSRFITTKMSDQISVFVSSLVDYRFVDLLRITFVSLMRYIVFCIQLFLMLRFFDVRPEFWQALIGISASYLFITFTPSVAFSEAAVRSSFAVLFIGAFSNNVVGIALAGVLIWMVNSVVPMLVGSVVMIRKSDSIE